MKIKLKPAKPYYKSIKKTASTLCCKINPLFQCEYCKSKLCADCGRAWSGRRHFIVDLCRSRFTSEELAESAACFKKRIVDGIIPTRLGNCKVCRTRVEEYPVDTDRKILRRKK